MPGNDPVGYNCFYSFGKDFDLIFQKTFCTSLSVAFRWIWIKFNKLFVLSICKHHFVYLSLLIITTPLPLSAFKISSPLVSHSSLTTFLYLYGSFVLVHLSHLFLKFVLIFCNSFSGMLEISLSKLWKKTLNSV